MIEFLELILIFIKKMYKLKLFKSSIIYLLVSFSGLYITKIGLSPIYFFSFLGFMLFLAFFKNSLKITLSEKLSVTTFLYFLITNIFLNFDPSALIGLLLSFAVYFVVSNTITNLNTTPNYNKVINLFFFVTLPLLIAETIIRYAYPIGIDQFVEMGREDIIFYIFKFNSIMFPDSNFTAILILCIISSFFYLKSINSENKNRLIFIILYVLLILTLSRAAILSGILLLLLFKFRDVIYKFRKFILFFSPIFLLVIISYITLIEDDSIKVKFQLFDNAKLILKDINSIDLLFGVGLGNGQILFGKGTHNLILTYLFEGGVIGLLLFFTFMSHLLFKTKYKLGIIIFPFLLAGMSFSSTSIPFLFAILALFSNYEENRSQYFITRL
jgi:hypothetical protein